MATETVSSRIGIDLVPPYGIYIDGELQDVCGSRAEAQQRFRELQGVKRPMPQAPIAAPRYRVLYLENGKEKGSPWLYRHEHAKTALQVVQRRVGEGNAIIYVD
jgi:hypothetical protein